MVAKAALLRLVSVAHVASVTGFASGGDRTGATETDSLRRPLAFAASGGGFRTMTMAMGFARAMEPSWPRVTHLAGNSGGNWFGTMFTYGDTFYNRLMDADDDLELVITDWGDAYAKEMIKAVDNGYAWATTFDTGEAGGLCAAVPVPVSRIPDKAWDAMVSKLGFDEEAGFITVNPHKLLEEYVVPAADNIVGLPAQHWTPYIAALLRPSVPDINSLRYSTRAMSGLATATFVQQTALAPDVWIDTTTQKELSVTFEQAFDKTVGKEFRKESPIVPLAHVQPPTGEGHWLTHKGIASFGVKETTKQGAKTEALNLNPDPMVNEVSAGSSAAFGWLGSPEMAGYFLRKNMPGLAMAPIRSIAMSCLPYGLETTSSAMLENDFASIPEDYTDYTVKRSEIKYRYLDGCYADDTSAAATLGQMMRECAQCTSGGACELDCSENEYDLIIMDDGGHWNQLFKVEGQEAGTFVPEYCFDGNGLAPSAQIFAEAEPSDTSFTDYLTTTLTPGTGKLAKMNPAAGKAATSSYWSGTLTTVNNDWYGVTAGAKVRTLIFKSNYDDPYQFIIYGSTNAHEYFSRVYAPMAAKQSAAVAPIISAWIGA